MDTVVSLLRELVNRPCCQSGGGATGQSGDTPFVDPPPLEDGEPIDWDDKHGDYHSYKCDAAAGIVDSIISLMQGLTDNHLVSAEDILTIGVPAAITLVLGIIAALVGAPITALLVGVVGAVAAFVSQAAVEGFDAQEIINALQANRDDILCCLETANNKDDVIDC